MNSQLLRILTNRDFNYINLSFKKLSRNLQKIEDEILQNLKECLIALIEANGLTVAHDKFWNGAQPNSINFNYDKPARTLIVHIVPEEGTTIIQKSAEVSLFGAIRKLAFSYPAELDFFSDYENLFHEQITEIYNALEVSYIINCSAAQGELTKKIHYLFNLKLTKYNKAHLIDRCYFNVAKWKKNRKTFVYIIDEKRIKSIIDYYKKYQPKSLRSPYYMINCLLTERVPDIITDIAIENGGQMEIPFENFTYKEDEKYHDFWKAEKHLFQNERLCMTIISKHKGQFLELIYPKNLGTEIEEIIPQIREDLEKQFMKNFEEFKQYYSLINRENLIDSKLYQECKDIFIKIFSNVVGDFAKPQT